MELDDLPPRYRAQAERQIVRGVNKGADKLRGALGKALAAMMG